MEEMSKVKNNLFKDISSAKINDVRTSRKWNDDTIALSVGDSDFAVPETILNKILEKMKIGDFSYNKGEHLKVIIRDYLKQQKFFLKETSLNIDYTIGAISALQIAILLHTKKGEYVLTTNPTYPPFIEIIENLQRKPLFISISKNNEINFDVLKSICKKTDVKLLILCNPNNPTAKIYSKEELLKIKDIIYKNNGYIYSDEVWGDLTFNKKAESFAKLDTNSNSRIVTVLNLGKSFNLHSLTFGYVVSYNSKLIAKFKKMKEKNSVSSHISPLNMYAIEACYSKEGLNWIKEYKKYLLNNYEALKNGLSKSLIIVPNILATHMIFLDFNLVKCTHQEIELLLKKANVLLSDGLSFGTLGYKRFRLNLSVTNQKIKEAIRRLNNIKEFND